MSEEYSIGAIAYIRTDFPTKFGIPRQSGIVDGLRARIVFEPGFANPDAVRGIEQFSHLWLIWRISAVPAAAPRRKQKTRRVRYALAVSPEFARTFLGEA